MSNIPISSLPIALALTGSEAVPLVQAGTTKSATVSLINSSNPANLPTGGLLGQALVKATNSNYDTTWATVSGLGTVQEVDTGSGLTGGPITLTGTISLASIATGNVLANVSGISAAPAATTPSAVLDVIGSTQGDLLYRSASGWSVLPPGTNGQILTTGGAGANPAWSAVGSGTVQSVGLSLPAIFTVSGSPVTTTGTLTGTLATQSANLVWAGPSSGVASAPTFRSLVGADLPNPSATTLGGIQSTTGASHQWISTISTSGVPGLSQPAFSDISGTVAASQLPDPTTSSLGGVQAVNAVASNWVHSISTLGVPQLSQPAFSDLSGTAALAQLPSIGNNTVLSNISGSSSTPLANSISSILDTIGGTQGDVLYRDVSGWSVLGPGTNGQVLTTAGAAANPSWTTVSGTGTVTSVGTNNGLTGGPITSSGTIGLATIATGNVLAYTGAGSGVPTATAPSAVLDVIGSTEGDILYRGASNWSVLAPGTSGQFLQTAGAGSTPSWAAAVTGAGSTTNTALTRWNGTTGNSIENSTVLLDGSGNLTAVNSIAGNVIATKAQQVSGTSAVNVTTPSVQQNHSSAAKAWINFSGGASPTINASYNISGISRVSAGIYTITFSTPFTSANYVAIANGSNNGTTDVRIVGQASTAPTASTWTGIWTTTTNTVSDPGTGFVVFYGTQ